MDERQGQVIGAMMCNPDVQTIGSHHGTFPLDKAARIATQLTVRSATPAIFPARAGKMAGRRDFRPPGAGDSGPGTAGVPLRRASAFPCAPPRLYPRRRRSGAAPASPTNGGGPAAARRPLPKARFQSARGSGAFPHGSGGAGPRAWRSPSLLPSKGTVAASWPIRNLMRQRSRSPPPMMLHFVLEVGR